MNQIHKSTKRHPERGITLISLIATIIILVILTAIVVKMITGDSDLIGTTTGASENYKVAEYKEIITQTITGKIQTNMMKGEGTTLSDIAGALEEKNDIATANVYEDETIHCSDILVTTVERLCNTSLL